MLDLFVEIGNSNEVEKKFFLGSETGALQCVNHRMVSVNRTRTLRYRVYLYT